MSESVGISVTPCMYVKKLPEKYVTGHFMNHFSKILFLYVCQQKEVEHNVPITQYGSTVYVGIVVGVPALYP